MILKASLLLALAGFLISFGVSFQALGLDQGMIIHEYLMDEHRLARGEEAIRFAAHGPRTYEYFSNHYGVLTFLFVLLILALLTEMTLAAHAKVICRVIYFGSMAIIFYQLRTVIGDMSTVSPFVWDAFQNTVAKSWMDYPWILGAITLTIFCLQLVALVPWFSSEKIAEVSSSDS